MTTPLQSMTPELYGQLGPRAQRLSDRTYARRWAAKVPGTDPMFAAMRAYTQAQLATMMGLGVFAYAGAILIGVGRGTAWTIVVGVLLIAVWVGIAVRSYLRMRQIALYFRERGVSARARGR